MNNKEIILADVKKANTNFQEVIDNLSNNIYKFQALRHDITQCKDTIFGYNGEDVLAPNQNTCGQGILNTFKDLNNFFESELNKCITDIESIKRVLQLEETFEA